MPVLLAGVGGREVVIVCDPTPDRDRATMLCLGIVVRHRVLPLLWRVVPQQATGPDRLPALLGPLLAAIAAALPPGTTVTLLADRGLVGTGRIDAAAAVGWHLVLRWRAGAGEEKRVRLGAGPEQRLADLPTRPGQRLASPAAIFTGAGWRHGYLTIPWAPGQDEPWVLCSDRPAGHARGREYRQRARVAATDQDDKGRGCALERSNLVALDRIERLLVALHLARWWASGLGLQAIRNGQRHRDARRDRRALSVVRLGRCACLNALDHQHLPALPFRLTPAGWVYPWLQ